MRLTSFFIWNEIVLSHFSRLPMTDPYTACNSRFDIEATPSPRVFTTDFFLLHFILTQFGCETILLFIYKLNDWLKLIFGSFDKYFKSISTFAGYFLERRVVSVRHSAVRGRNLAFFRSPKMISSKCCDWICSRFEVEIVLIVIVSGEGQ